MLGFAWPWPRLPPLAALTCDLFSTWNAKPAQVSDEQQISAQASTVVTVPAATETTTSRDPQDPRAFCCRVYTAALHTRADALDVVVVDVEVVVAELMLVLEGDVDLDVEVEVVDIVLVLVVVVVEVDLVLVELDVVVVGAAPDSEPEPEPEPETPEPEPETETPEPEPEPEPLAS